MTIDGQPDKGVTLVHELNAVVAGIRPLHSICDNLALARVEPATMRACV